MKRSVTKTRTPTTSETPSKTLEQRVAEREARYAKPPRIYKTSPARRGASKRHYWKDDDSRAWILFRTSRWNTLNPDVNRKASREYQERDRRARQIRNHKKRVLNHEARMKALIEAGGGIAPDGSLIPAPPIADGQVHLVRRF